MAYTQSDLEAVQTAILALAKGERTTSVTFSSGTSVDYGPASLSDLRSLEAGIASALGNKRRQIRFSSSKGL
jgi:hypothetical protein